MDIDELKIKFENKLNTWEAGLKTPEFTDVDCRGLSQDLKIVEADEELWASVIADINLRNRILEVYFQLAKKMAFFGNTKGALEIINTAKMYSADNQNLKNRLEGLEQQIINPPKAAPAVKPAVSKNKNPARR